MIFSLIVGGLILTAAVWYVSTKGKGAWGLPLVVAGVVAFAMVVSTSSLSPQTAAQSSGDFTVTELSSVTYALDPDGHIADGDELEFIYVDDAGVSKAMSVEATVVRYEGGMDTITITEKDYSAGRFIVPWGYGAVVTEAVVR